MLKRKSLSCGLSFLFCLLFSFLHKKEKKVRRFPLAGKAVNENNPPLEKESRENLKSVTFEGKRVSGNRVKPLQ